VGPKNQIPTDALEQQGRAGSSEKPTDAPLRAMIESFSLLRKDKKKAGAESNRTSWEARKAPDSAIATYSITSSAISKKSRPIVKPSALAVFRLTTSSNFVACWTGNSAGFAPLRILSK
jgi:hypothetical protein